MMSDMIWEYIPGHYHVHCRHIVANSPVKKREEQLDMDILGIWFHSSDSIHYTVNTNGLFDISENERSPLRAGRL